MNIEPLEARIAPAVLIVNATTATYTDIDGDKVTIKFSTGTLNNGVFTSQLKGLGEQLLLINLSAGGWDGADLTMTVAKAATGDGVANIGAINSTGHDLGKVTIAGDLGQIDAGDATTTTTALELLKVRSMGVFGISTQQAGGSLVSDINGPLDALVVTGDLHEATINAIANNKADGRIGSVTIGGSLIGSTDEANRTGEIQTSGDMGPVKIGGDVIGGAQNMGRISAAFGTLASVTVTGSVRGGSGADSGKIFAGSTLGPVKIGGDLIGGLGFGSGSISSNVGNIISVTIGGSVLGGGPESAQIESNSAIGPVRIGGNVVGGQSESAQINAGTTLGAVTIGGSLVGGAGVVSGYISAGGDIGAVRIGGDVKGSSANLTGRIDVGGRLASLTIGGSLIGGAGVYQAPVVMGVTHGGQVFALTGIGAVKIGGDVLGGSGAGSGAIKAGTGNDGAVVIDSVAIGGSLVGGTANETGYVGAGTLGAVTIARSLIGGSASSAGALSANGGDLASVKIGGSLVGGSVGPSAGALFSRGNMGPVTIGGDLLGGSGDRAGYVSSFGALESVKIGGSLIGGTGPSAGGISSRGELGEVSIAHDLLGGSLAPGTGDNFGAGAISGEANIGRIFIGGSIVSGVDSSAVGDLSRNASIRAALDIGSLTVLGSIVGNVTTNGDATVIISAFGQGSPSANLNLAFGSITVGGRVEWARILAGYDLALAPLNADAQIGPVKVGADCIASSLVAGAQNLGNDGAPGGTGLNADNVNFGDFRDQKIAQGDSVGTVSRIGSITIGGQVFGTTRANDAFGFVAEEVGSLKVGGRTFTLNPGKLNDGVLINPRYDALLTDATLHEITPALGVTFSASPGAKLVSKNTVTYTESDGDRVTVKLSKPLLTATNVNDVFKFDTGMVNVTNPDLQHLRFIDLRPLATNGIGVTVTVVRGAIGDGLANVGGIVARGFDVGAVNIPGDLGHLIAGDATLTTAGVQSLTVRTLGRLGLQMQGPGSVILNPTLTSDIEGGLGALTVKQDLVNALVEVNGPLGAVTIGGSLIGGETFTPGSIKVEGKIGTVKIAHHLQGGPGAVSGAISGFSGTSIAIGGSMLGAGGGESGSITIGELSSLKVGHNVLGNTGSNSGKTSLDRGSVQIGGSLLGGAGAVSARVVSDEKIGAVKIAHNLVGGGADRAGRIESYGITSVTIGGALLGGAGQTSGNITAYAGSDLGPVKIGFEVIGGAGMDSGQISAGRNLASATVGGSMLATNGPAGASIEILGDSGSISIGGNLKGGVTSDSGKVSATGRIGAFSLGGSLIGGGDSRAGGISADLGLSTVKIGRDVHGGSSVGESGSILSRAGVLKSVTVGGSLFGGSGFDSGEIFSNGDAGSVKIGRDVIGGSINGSGLVSVRGKLSSLTIGGSLVGGTGSISGAIYGDEIGTVKIGRNLVGGSIGGTTGPLTESGYIVSLDRLSTITISGSVLGGFDTSTGGSLTKNASIRAADEIGAISIKGSLHGTSTTNGLNPVIISARSSDTATATTDLVIQSLKIGGRVERAFILGGYGIDVDAADLTAAFLNNQAQIGAVSVGRDWIASSISAGVVNTGAGFGDGNDALALFGGGPLPQVAKIASIVIKGATAGTTAPGDHFGFVAVKIGSFKTLGFSAKLTAAKDAPIELSLPTADVTIREV